MHACIITTPTTLGPSRTCTDDYIDDYTGTVQMTIELASPEAHVLPWERDLLAKIRYY